MGHQVFLFRLCLRESLDSEILRVFLRTRKVCDRLLTDSSIGSIGEGFHGRQEKLFSHDNFVPFLCPASVSWAQWTSEIENVTIPLHDFE